MAPLTDRQKYIVDKLIREQLELLPSEIENSFNEFETRVEGIYNKAMKALMDKLIEIKVKPAYQAEVKRQLNYIMYGELIPKIVEIKNIFSKATTKKK